MTADASAKGTEADQEMEAKPVEVDRSSEWGDSEPRLVAFCCQFCAYAAADLAGVSRLQYPTNIRIIRLLCTGKIDELYVLRAFEQGADGVLIAGCLEGNCHFIDGNIRARKRIDHVKKLLEEIGLEPERLEMFNMSAAMSQKFADTAKDMIERIRKLGPSPLRKRTSGKTDETVNKGADK
jgi:coenzyme F420-reducing hydrogenase delta subunit